MAVFDAGRVVVGTKAKLICSPAAACTVLLVNNGNEVLYVSNNSAVTTLIGCPILPHTSIPFTIGGAGSLYGILARGENEVHFLNGA